MADEITRGTISGYEAELDPDRQDQARIDYERMDRRVKLLAATAKADLAQLMKNPAFIRYFFTIQDRAGMGLATYHAQEHGFAYEAGRRALGLELTREALGLDPGFAIALAIEQAKLEETLNGPKRPEPQR